MSHTECAKDPTKAEYNQSYQGYKTYQQETAEIAGKEYVSSRCTADIGKTRAENQKAHEAWKIQHPGGRPQPEKKVWDDFQGGFGEYAATAVGESEGLHQTNFNKLEPKDPNEPGFDNVMQDSTGRFWIIEAKCTDTPNGIQSLKTINGLKEGTIPWIADRLRRMLDPNDPDGYYKAENVPLAQQMLAAGVESFGRLVVHMHPLTLNVTVSKGVGDLWEPVATYRPIEK